MKTVMSLRFANLTERGRERDREKIGDKKLKDIKPTITMSHSFGLYQSGDAFKDNKTDTKGTVKQIKYPKHVTVYLSASL